MNHVKNRDDVNSSLPYGADRNYKQTRSGNWMQSNSLMFICTTVKIILQA